MRGVEDSMTDARIFELSFLRQFGLAGLGIAESKSKEYPSGGKGDAVWQRLSLDFGQNIICKRRANPQRVPSSNLPLNSGHILNQK